MTDYRLLKKMYEMATTKNSVGVGNGNFTVDNYLKFLNPEDDKKKEAKLKKQINRLIFKGYIYLDSFNKPFRGEFVQFTVYAHIELQSRVNIWLAAILSIFGTLLGVIIGFLLDYHFDA